MVQFKPLRVIILGSAALVTAVPMALLAAPNEVGIASAVVNDVKLRNSAAAQQHPVKVREHLALADQISTGMRSQLQVLLLDKSVFTVGANARLTIDRFVYDSRGSSVSASVAKGAFRFMSGGGGHKSSGSSIKTPVSTIGIRGTIIDGVIGPEAVAIARGEGKVPSSMVVDPETATLVVLRGPGTKTAGNVTVGAISVTAGGKTVNLDKPMLAVFVPAPGAEPIGPFTISLPGLTRLTGLILPHSAAILPGNSVAPYPVPAPPRRIPPYRYPGYDGTDTTGPNPGRYIPGMPNLPTQQPRPPERPPADGPTPQSNHEPAPEPTPQPTPQPPPPSDNNGPTPSPSPTPSVTGGPNNQGP